MPVGLKPNELLLRCVCKTPSHMLLIDHEPEDKYAATEGSDDWSMTMWLDAWPLLRRLRIAFWYIMRPYRFEGATWTMLTDDDMDKLIAFVQKRRDAKRAAAAPVPALLSEDDGAPVANTEALNQ